MQITDEVANMAQSILSDLSDNEWMVTTAESCTGGLLASILTDVEGQSHAFDRGFVVYSDEAKFDLLGIEQELLDEYGAVSKEVAVAMSRGALMRSGAHFAIAITGFAGPGGKDDEEGLVHFACASNEQNSHLERHFGPVGRDGVRSCAVKCALELLRSTIDSRMSK